ncbi:restriction endonuclease subunit S [Carnobacterium maltaromaticum]|uniref:restriction endonuclease subunit S n=1 Tax=Carnobacterium maltaromaticum TaxID=2751 RepID=UPI0039BE0A95
MENLLDGVEVEWKALEEVFNILAGGDVPKDALSDIKTEEFCIPILSNGIGDKSLYGWTNKAKIVNPSLTISARGTIGWTSFRDEPFFPIVRLLVLTPKIEFNLKYAYHFMKMIENDYKTPKTGIPQLTKPMIKDIKIPIPCPDNPEKSLEIQAEIVRILDTFTELTAELTAELAARKKQYTYYRDKLLTFEEGEVEWKALGEVTEFSNGKGHEKDIIEDGKYIVVNSKFISTDGQVAKYSNKQICPLIIDDILIVMSDLPNGKALSKTFIVDKNDKYTLNQRIGKISVKNKQVLLPKFLQYFLNRTPQLLKYNNGVDQTNLRKAQILGIQVPIPPLEEQERIVNILDKFDTLTTSITEGLPREIELRQKQYEYYRNMLLSFPKEVV